MAVVARAVMNQQADTVSQCIDTVRYEGGSITRSPALQNRFKNVQAFKQVERAQGFSIRDANNQGEVINIEPR